MFHTLHPTSPCKTVPLKRAKLSISVHNLRRPSLFRIEVISFHCAFKPVPGGRTEEWKDMSHQKASRTAKSDPASQRQSALDCQRLALRATETTLIFLRITHTIFEFPISQPIHEPINMTELPGVETRTGANPSLYSYRNTIGSTDTM